MRSWVRKIKVATEKRAEIETEPRSETHDAKKRDKRGQSNKTDKESRKAK